MRSCFNGLNCTWIDAAYFSCFAKSAVQIIQLDTYGVGLKDQHPQNSFWAHVLRSWSSAYVTAIIFVSYHFLCHLNFGFWNCWCQLSCNLSDQLQHVISAVSSVATYQLSCTLSAQMKLVISTATCWLSCSLSAQLQLVNSAAKVKLAAPCPTCCQLNLLAWLSAQLHPVTSDVICHVSSSASSHHQSIWAAVYPLS